MVNPGGFRTEIGTAKKWRRLRLRNGTMLKMFNLIDVGECTGSGIPNIFRVWRDPGGCRSLPSPLNRMESCCRYRYSKAKNSDKKVAINVGHLQTEHLSSEEHKYFEKINQNYQARFQYCAA